MRILISVLLALSLVGCTAADEQVPTQAPTAEVNPAPGTEETKAETEESQESETEPENQQDRDQSTQTEDSPSPTPSAQETKAATTEAASPKPTETSTPKPTETSTPKPTETSTPKPTQSLTGYTLAQVAEKNTQSACWVAIDGMVYDLTAWIRSHPGGRSAIISLCGTDGTSSFLSQHGGQSTPSATLDQYVLGPLIR
jgi:cytochrome b involved in lipid metabolism